MKPDNSLKSGKLPKDFKKKWVDALRSGEYKQGVGELYDGTDKFCCLGVACVVAGVSSDDIRGDGTISTYFTEVPDAIKGMTKTNPIARKLTAMNDGERGETKQTFKEIATWIEENL